MANINRDYFVILDVKSGELSGSTQMYFYNTDKNTSNIYVQLVVRETPVNATPIENATNYIVEAKIVKPGPVTKDLTATLVNESQAIYEFDLPDDCTNLSGSYKIEFWVKAKVADRDELITSSKAKYKVKKSILTDLDEAIEDSTDYPLLLQLMEEVRVINATAHELDTQIRTLQSDMIAANETMKDNEASRQFNEALRQMNETNRNTQENARQEYFNGFDAKWEEYKTNTTNDITDYKESINTDISDFKSTTSNDIANYKAQINAQEVIRETNEEQRKANEVTRTANEDDRIYKEDRRESQERDRVSNEYDRQNAEQSREYAEIDRVANEEQRQTNEANRETAEEIRKANEQSRITAENARVTEHEQMRTELNEVKAENAILMENDKKIADRMTQVEISDKRQYVIMEGLMNSAGDGYLKIEDTGNDTTLYNSVEGFVDVKNITGNTMVNSIKNPDDELTLNGDINTSGQSVTLTTAVDNGQVDVLAEGNTMVNVCDQQEAVAITKSYTVENGNHIALQGEFDGKARPVPTGNTLVNCLDIKGNNNILGDKVYSYVTDTEFIFDWSKGQAFNNWIQVKNNINLVQEGKTYTVVLNILENNPTLDGVSLSGNINLYMWFNGFKTLIKNIPYGTTGLYKYTISLTANSTQQKNLVGVLVNSRSALGDDSDILINGGKLRISRDILVLEGDYTNKPIPDYFEGMQSSFEDKLVTQEMVDSGKELAENLGKYRVDYKVTGKNKISSNFIEGWLDTNTGNVTNATGKIGTSDLIRVKPNTTYTITKSDGGRIVISKYDYGKNLIGYNGTRLSFTTDSNTYYIRIFIDDTTVLTGHQLEEGSTATAYEPYKESIKTYYLNSPLLEGDTIEESNGNVYHIHRYGKVVLDGSENWTPNIGDDYWIESSKGYVNTTNVDMINDKFPVGKFSDCTRGSNIINLSYGIRISLSSITATNDNIDTLKAWLSANPITVIHKLASPQYELISQNDTILTDSYVAGHLDFDTAVPVERVRFNRTNLRSLKYLYPNTEYTIQFESDNVGRLQNAYIGSDHKQGALINVAKGINKFNITLTNTQSGSFPYFSWDGIGFSASNIVVTEATDKDFGYFSGMKSVGELEENKIEILSRNKNLFDTNKFILGKSMYGYMYLGDKDIYIFNITEKDSSIDISGIYFGFTGNGKNGDEGDSWAIGQGSLRNPNLFNSNYKYISIYPNTQEALDKITSRYNIQIEEGTTATNYIPHAENKKQILLNEPLRAVGDTKDRFVQIDGKWYVERNVAEVDISTLSWNTSVLNDNDIVRYWAGMNHKHPKQGSYVKCNILPNYAYTTLELRTCEGIGIKGGSYSIDIGINLHKNKNILDSNSLVQWLTNNSLKITYQLDSPIYEPVEIAPTLNTYTDVTHITNNSTIPMNMPIVNSGYEVIAKPSTKYTVVGMTNGRIGDSTIVNGTITTPATITDNFLRPYGTGKTSKVMLLEGELANIPGYFKGIKSVFEDKVTEDGKYACEVRVYNDLGEETKQTLYLDEPLYNTNNITIYNDKLGYWKNYDIRDYQDGDFGTYLTDMTKTAYQLAEPVFVPLIDNCPNWIIGSWDNCSIHFDSIIPLKDTRYRYTGNVPSVVTMSDDVAATKSISDEQDAMIVDLATEVAVMEMMLM